MQLFHMSLKQVAIRFFTSLGLFIMTATAVQAQSLDCNRATQITVVLLKNHFSIQTFDDELSTRMFDRYLTLLDPMKTYFTQADINELKEKYEKNFDDFLGKTNCEPVTEIMKRFNRRFDETLPHIAKMIDTDHDFKVDEYLVFDSKEQPLPWAADRKEIEDRWRKRIKFQVMQLKNAKEDIKKIREKLHKRYQLVAKRNNERTTSDMYGIFLDAAATSLDPHSDYFTEDEIEDFRINSRLSLEGIGAALGSEDGFTTIQSLIPGGAADRTGKLKEKDKILAVGQGDATPVNVFDMDLREVVKLVRGPRNTEVRLTIQRDDEAGSSRFVVPVIREEIKLEDKSARSFVYDVKAKTREGQNTVYKVGFIDLPSFYFDFQGRMNKKTDFKSSSEDVRREILALKKAKVDAIIMDLRSNGGGALEESVKIAGFFIESGPVVQVKGLDGDPNIYADENPEILYDGPLIVMINRSSASASEIVAGAIKDFGRGLIVGDSHTFGKGTVQNVTDIPGQPGSIKITIQKFYTPLGASTQLEGVSADVVLPSIWEAFGRAEKDYDYALDFSRVAPAPIKNFNMTTPYVEQLKSSSEQRILKDAKFIEIREEIAKYNAKKAERSRISLKEGSKEDEANKKLEEDLEEEENQSKRSKDPKVEKVNIVSRDAYLQETLRIAGDYVNLLRKKPMPVAYELPDVKVEKKVAQVEGTKKVAADKAPKDKEKVTNSKPAEKKQ